MLPSGQASDSHDEPGIPIVYGVRDPGTNWIVILCPLCHLFHVHGAGGIDAPLGDTNGHRSSHCFKKVVPGPDRGYHILEVFGPIEKYRAYRPRVTGRLRPAQVGRPA